MTEVEEILKQIKERLTGDKKQDLKYLKGQMEAFHGHEFGGEIAKECSRLMYDLLSEEERNEAVVEMGKDRVVDIQIDEDEEEEEEEDAQYYSFYEFFEEIMVNEFVKPDKAVRRSEIPHADIFLNRGMDLMSEGKYEEAKESFANARKWNPVNAHIAFCYMDSLIALDQWDEVHETALTAIYYAFRPDTVAKGFAYLGRYFEHQGEKKPAAACFHIALQFEADQKEALASLKKSGIHLKEKEIKKIAEEYEFLPGPNPAILALATGLGEQLFGNQMIDGATYCYNIVYGLTGDDKVKELMEGLAKINM